MMTTPPTWVAQHADGTVFRVHDLRTAEPYFGMIESGSKPFEIRLNDRAFQCGDVLRLFRPREHADGSVCRSVECFQCPAPPDHLLRSVVCVFTGDVRFPDKGGLRSGYCVLGLGRWPYDDNEMKAAIEAGALIDP